MKHILLACILSVGAVTSPVLAQPAAAQTQIESLQDMASWMQSATTIQTDLMALFSADAMTNMYSTINTGDMDAINRLGQSFEAERQVVLARASRQIADLPPPEKWNIDRRLFLSQDKATHQAAKIQYNSLQETYSLFDTLTRALSDILNSTESVDDTQLASLLDVQFKASVRLIELENEQVDGFLAAIPKDNPNHQFQKILKQFNLASIQELNITMKADSLEQRQASAKVMGDELNKIRPLIRRGQKNLATQKKIIEQIPPHTLSADERAMLPVALKIYENIEEAFNVETKILASMQSSYELYLSNKSDEDIEASVQENDLRFFNLVETRAELMQARLTAIQ